MAARREGKQSRRHFVRKWRKAVRKGHFVRLVHSPTYPGEVLRLCPGDGAQVAEVGLVPHHRAAGVRLRVAPALAAKPQDSSIIRQRED
jgi:hypothetical protein